MPLEGLRAWIGEVERKLGMRTRVFLVLSVIALGGAGAAIYLAVEAREDSVSESDVRALQERLETRIDEAAAGAAPVTPEEPAESVEPAPQPEPKPEGGESGSSGASAPKGESSAKLKELFEEAEKRKAEAEAHQNTGK